MKDAIHTDGYGESKGYVLGEKLNTERWTMRHFPADCAVIRNMIAFGEQFACALEAEAQETLVMTPQVDEAEYDINQGDLDEHRPVQLEPIVFGKVATIDDVLGADFDFSNVEVVKKDDPEPAMMVNAEGALIQPAVGVDEADAYFNRIIALVDEHGFDMYKTKAKPFPGIVEAFYHHLDKDLSNKTITWSDWTRCIKKFDEYVQAYWNR